MRELEASWRVQPVELAYRIGEISLFSAGFTMSVLDAHFTGLDGGRGPDVWRDRLATEASDVEGILLRSHPVEHALPRLSWSAAAARYVPRQYLRYHVALTGTFEEYLQRFSAKSRSTLQRKVRRFMHASGGSVHWREFRAPEEMADFHRLARQVARLTYQDTLLHTALPEDDGFVQTMLKRAGERMVMGFILFIHDRPVAYLYSPMLPGGIVLYQYVGYDPAFAEWSPGTVLQYVVLERCFRDDALTLFDFTEGEGPQKAFFATASTRCADVYYFRRRPRAVTLILLHAMLESAITQVGGGLARLGLKRQLKSAIRSWAGRRDA